MRDSLVTIEQIEQWDEKAFRLLYDEYYKALVAYAYRITGDSQFSEDTVQELFSVLYERKFRFGSVVRLKSYLYNTVYHSSVDFMRHKQTLSAYESQALHDIERFESEEDKEEGLFSEEFYRHLNLFVEQLPQRQKEIFILAMKGRKNSEIAEALSISLETVKTHKKRLMSTIRKNFRSPNMVIYFLCMLS